MDRPGTLHICLGLDQEMLPHIGFVSRAALGQDICRFVTWALIEVVARVVVCGGEEKV